MKPRWYHSGNLAPEGVWVEADEIPKDMVKIGSINCYHFYGYL